MKKILFVALAVVLGVVVAALLAQRHVEQFGQRPLAVAEVTVFEVKRGSSFRKVVEQLSEQGLIHEALLFRLYARNRQAATRIHAGEYRLDPGMTHQQLLDAMVGGKVMYHQLTLVEGLRLRDYLAQLRAHEAVVFDLEGDSPEAVAALLGTEQKNPEGWIYPDTYSFPRGTRASTLLRNAHQQTQDVLEDEWRKRSGNLPISSPYEALILASIIEKETGVPDERAAIAGVFVRRLQKGMRLQTDPTVIYGMGDSYRGRIGRADLRRKTAYNTYQINGLPPTPIASPARAAIHAALNPAAGKALYFVAKGDGSHQFSGTLREHNRAVEKYQRSGRRSDYRSAPPPAAGSKGS